MAMSDWWLFLRAWSGGPRRIGAIAPSGPALASLIVSRIDPGDVPVLELGAGTGVFTQALVDKGIAPRDLMLVECEERFAQKLRERFPEAQVLTVDAGHLDTLPLAGGRQLGAVVSGLPLLTMPSHKVKAILGSAFRRMRPGGAFYQFTYGLRSPVPRRLADRLDLRITRVGKVHMNLPPATVYRITQHVRVKAPVARAPAEHEALAQSGD